MASENGARDTRQQPPPKTEYEGASRAWVEAKERLLAAQQNLAEAQMEASKAVDDEAGAWERLQNIAGRGPQPGVDGMTARGKEFNARLSRG